MVFPWFSYGITSCLNASGTTPHLAVDVQRGAVQRRAAGRGTGVLEAAEG